jgi:hypothetical protein
MTDPATSQDPFAASIARRTQVQFLWVAVAEGVTLASLVGFFFVLPDQPYLAPFVWVLLVIGVALTLIVLVLSARLVLDGGPLRRLGALSIVLLFLAPLVLLAIGLFGLS